MGQATGWSGILAPLPPATVALLSLLLLLLGGIVLRRAPGTLRLVVSTLIFYAISLLFLPVANLALQAGWTPGGTALRQLAILLIGIAIIRLSGALLFRVGLPALRISPPSILEDLLVFAAYLLWAMVRLSQVGVELGSILTTSAVLTAILAFSLQDTLGNILGGTTLQLDNSLHVGDWVAIGGTVGRVVDIRWRSTLIETRDWETVVMPNAVLMKTPFAILGRRSGEPTQLRRWVRFTVAFEVPPRKVIDTVEQAMARARIPNVARRPPPNCVVTEVDDSRTHYALRYWLTDLHVDDPTDSAVRLRLHAALQRQGIRFALPEQTVHLVKEGEKRRRLQAQAEHERRARILQSVALFGSLSAEELDTLTGYLVHAPFLAGETLTAQGDTAHWLYLLVSGEVEIVLQSDTGDSRRVGTLKAGTPSSIFGEMSLLTGAPRSASVIALTDVECYRLERAGLEAILRQRPAIAEEMSGIMATRQADLAEAREEIARTDRSRMVRQSRGEILDRIRHFFHLDEA